MRTYHSILNRVGVVLIVFGILDTVYLIYYLLQNSDDSSSVGILAVLGGILLLRGSLQTVPLITWVTAFLLSIFVSILLILLPLSKPAALWAIEFNLEPISFSLLFLMRIITIAVLFWVYRQLRSTAVLSATANFRHSATTTRLAFILGIAFVITFTGIFRFATGGAAGEKAVELARKNYGEGYNYHVTGLQWSNAKVQANLTAYNEQEIKSIQVEWKQ